MDPFAIEVVHLDGSVVLALRGELDLAGVPEIQRALQPVLPRYRPGQIVFDCSALTFMDATGLGALVAIIDSKAVGDDKPTLRNANRAVTTLLRITQALGFFNLDDLASTIRSGEPFDIEDPR